MAHQPKPALIESLTSLWRSVLRRPSIGPQDNFFALGGDPSQAAELFSEIAKTFGRDLSPLTIYCAPTVAALAAVIENSSPFRLPPLIPLRAGMDAPPVFLTHGLGATVMDFFELLRHIETRRPIYGMQARGTDGADAPLGRIEDMAEYFFAAIREVQPRGPYILIGYSLGGLVTLEIAQRLLACGEQIALLALLESYPHRSDLPFGPRARLHTRLLLHHLSNAARGKIRRRPSIRATLSPAMQQVHDDSYLALTRYRPRPYPGKVQFVRAAVSLDFPDDPRAAWTGRIDDMEIETVPGDHQEIVATHFKELAAVLSRCLSAVRA
ncbi:MAG TPA: alpha/beta fold hydrolase [Candidatus Acidoferrales bacterium]